MIKYYITTPIYYVNDLPHIGHVFTTIIADFLAKMKKNLGYDVYFLTGTDEHGQKAEKTAKQLNISPKEMADRVVENYYKIWRRMNVNYSDFIRTTEARHIEGASNFFQKVYDHGDIYKGFYEGYYCWSCEAFLPESHREGETCPDCGKVAEKVKEASYFFRLSKYREPLLKYYKDNSNFIRPESRYNEVVSFVESGLKDLSVSRTSIKWGIPVPNDNSHVIYVWFDALSNYITALGWGKENSLFEKYWPADLHLVGKDILRFHCVYWPAFLMSANIELPISIYGHGWWMMHSAKMSKTFGNVLRPEPLLDIVGSDALRYFLLREAPLENDSDISLELLVDRINSDLANDYGNLLNRTLQMIDKYFNGILNSKPTIGSFEVNIIDYFNSLKNEIDTLCNNLNLQILFKKIWHLIYLLNKYIDEKQPWSKFKNSSNKKEVEGILYFIIDFIRILSILLYPAMPESSQKIYSILNIDKDKIYLKSIEPLQLPLGIKLPKQMILFPRLDLKELQIKLGIRD